MIKRIAILGANVMLASSASAGYEKPILDRPDFIGLHKAQQNKHYLGKSRKSDRKRNRANRWR